MGKMPPGRMTWYLHKKGALSCENFEQYGTWEIRYQFPNGIQESGVPYRGTNRSAFLPDCPEGREVLALLVKAFKRRHTMVVGTSVTTG